MRPAWRTARSVISKTPQASVACTRASRPSSRAICRARCRANTMSRFLWMGRVRREVVMAVSSLTGKRGWRRPEPSGRPGNCSNLPPSAARPLGPGFSAPVGELRLGPRDGALGGQRLRQEQEEARLVGDAALVAIKQAEAAVGTRLENDVE